MFFAKVDDDNICRYILNSATMKNDKSMIPISFMDTTLIGKKYVDGEWEETEPENTSEIPLTEQEQIAIDTALTVEYMACLLEANLG